MYEQFSGSAPGNQHVLNALPARDKPNRPPLPVRARLVWETDGEERVDGRATRLDPAGAIFVELADPRCWFIGVWLHPDDVWWPGKPGTEDPRG